MSMTHDEMIAVIAAHRDGKTIQCKSAHETEDWRDRIESPPTFDFYRYEYRIKPEPRKPRVLYVNEYEDKGLHLTYHTTLALAEAAASRNLDRGHIATRKFIEVIEEEQP